MLSDIQSLIVRHTRPSRSHLTPALLLRLLTPSCDLWGARGEESPFQDPYWAFYWPGGQAVAKYILDNGKIVRNRSVVDIGCGCGAVSIAAAKMNAKTVLANDIDLCAITATKLNADLNNVYIETSSKNLLGNELTDFDTVLIGDMFYDEEFSKLLFDWLRSLALGGKTVLIGDPGRHGLTNKRRELISLMATYKMPEESQLENHGFTDTTVWKMNGR